MTRRKKKSRQPKTTFADIEHQQLIADAMRIIDAWTKQAPGKKFGGVSLAHFLSFASHWR